MIDKKIINLVSRLVGKLADCEFPTFLQKVANLIFVSFLQIDLTEFEQVEKYASIQKLFTRKLKEQRTFSAEPEVLISPTDSKVAQFGKVKNGTILQVKGLDYEAAAFLTEKIDQSDLKRIMDGNFVNFYLSPSDYHHFHAPTDFQIDKIIHVPGTLFPVKKSSLEKNEDLFVKNERVILQCKTIRGKLFYFVAIGAFNVGKIKVLKEPRLQTNVSANNFDVAYEYAVPLEIRKGEEIGYFEMGSSIVLLFENDSVEFLSEMKVDRKIYFGESFARFI